MTAIVPDTTDRDVGDCPVIRYDHTTQRPTLGFLAEFDELRDNSPTYWNTLGQGFWILTKFDDVREAYQTPEIFSSDSEEVLDPNPAQRFIPTHINPPEHAPYRQALAKWFSPLAIERVSARAREICVENVSRIAKRGECDFVSDFGLFFPTQVLLELIGLPVEQAPMLLPWVETFFEGYCGLDKTLVLKGAVSIRSYYEEVLRERVKSPRDKETDFISYLLDVDIEGRKLTADEVLDICLVLTVAGLDTTRAQMGYLMYHLATHPNDRQQLIDDPSLIPSAVEEGMRVYPINLTIGRKVAKDTVFAGCPMKVGDMVSLSATAANRDPDKFPNPKEFQIQRESHAHLGFAAGPHRCLGAHLARREMKLMVEEWHKQIPNYHVREGADLVTRGGVMTILSLPLVWET